MAKISVKQQSYDYIKDRILNGQFQTGTFIDEREIALILGVSRTPVREAVNILVDEGFLTIYPKKGVIVRKISAQDISEVFQVREIIEPVAITKYAHNLSTKKLQYFKDVYNKGGFTEEEAHLLDDEFHLFIISAYKNEYMNNMFLDIRDKNRRIRTMSGSLKTGINITYKEHLFIIDLIENMETDKAGQELLEHIKASKRRALESFN